MSNTENLPETCHETGSQEPRRHRLRNVLLAIAGVFIVLIVVFLIFVGNYYHADETAQAALASSDVVAVEVSSDQLTFGNPATAKAGLILYPGAKVEASAYAPLASAIAQQGYLVVIEKMPLNLAVFRSGAAQETIDDYPQVTGWFIGGHSLGGAIASQWAGKHSDEVSGIIFLASFPASDLSDTSLAALSIYGSEDGVLDPEQYADAADKRPADWSELVIAGGDHAQFGDYGIQKGDGEATISATEQQAQTADAVCAFMSAIL